MENEEKFINQKRVLEGDITSLKAEIKEKETEFLTKKGKERNDLELEIEMLKIQYNARKKPLEGVLSEKLEK